LEPKTFFIIFHAANSQILVYTSRKTLQLGHSNALTDFSEWKVINFKTLLGSVCINPNWQKIILMKKSLNSAWTEYKKLNMWCWTTMLWSLNMIILVWSQFWFRFKILMRFFRKKWLFFIWPDRFIRVRFTNSRRSMRQTKFRFWMKLSMFRP